MRKTTLISLAVAVVLALLAVVAARGWLVDQRDAISAAARSGNQAIPTSQIVVAKKELRFGERITPDKIETIKWMSDRLPTGSFQDPAVLVGATDETARFVLEPLAEGEPILATKVTAPGQRAKLSTALSPGMKAVSIRVNDVLGVAGFVLPGDRVDVLLTRTGRNASDAYVDVLLQGVKVLAIDQIADERKDNPSVVRTVTFEVSTEEAQKLTLAGTIGTLSLALRNAVSIDTEESDRVTLNHLNNPEPAASLPDQTNSPEYQAELRRLESQINQLGANVDERISSMADALTPKPQPEAKPRPEFVTIGVTSHGRRTEYRIKPLDQ
ncbi:Flp pilus assembly protein CpaB [Pseudothioclava arenosa]|nr:Flp pilus assembly protein CpaB [Pseudothioclava arenosa]